MGNLMPDALPRTHHYHAEATVVEGHLRLPLEQEIKPQAQAKLPEEGGYLAQHAKDYKLESVISFRNAHTQVAGNPSLKPGHGWSTLATSMVEGLNVLDVVTADRVVAQISMDHPPLGYVPTVTFLGTRFENLRIAGHKVGHHFNLDILGPKPEKDAPYTKGAGFLDRVASQHEEVRKHKNLIDDLMRRYTGVSRDQENPEAVECSLVSQASGDFPGQCFGHVIHVPDFGTIILGRLRLEQSDYNQTGTPQKTLLQLTMIELKLGCVADGAAGIASMTTNGLTRP